MQRYPHALQKPNISFLLARKKGVEIYGVNNNISDENSTPHSQKLRLYSTVDIELSCEVSQKEKGLRSHRVHLHFIDKKAEVLGGSLSKAHHLPETRSWLSWLPCLNTFPSVLIFSYDSFQMCITLLAINIRKAIVPLPKSLFF